MNKLPILLLPISALLLFSFLSQFNSIAEPNDQIHHRNGYSISYNEEHEQPNWVFYTLTKEDLVCDVKAKRKNKFKADKNIPTGSASLKDYKKSGYDRGHLKSSADESCDQLQMNETFLMSNMSPQSPSFNRGIWKALEMHVRDLVSDNDSLYVYTGGVLKSGLKTIGDNKVSIPNHYYKLIYIFNHGNVSIEAYVMPNEKATLKYPAFEVGIDSLESITRMDFPNIIVEQTFPRR